MARELSEAAKVAKLCKQFAKSLGVTCSAKSSNYAGGDSVDVNYQDVSPAIHAKIEAHCRQYKAGSFNSMEDIYEYHSQKSGVPSTKYLFINNRFSDELCEKCWQWFKDEKQYANFERLPESYAEAKKRDFYDTDNTGYAQHHDTVEYVVYRILTRDFQYEDESDAFWQSLQPAKPEPVAVSGSTISKHTHTKKGFDMWIVELSDKVDRDTFNDLRGQCKSAGGWYSRKWGSTPGGFAFKSEADAIAFAENQDAPQAENQEPKPDTSKADKLRMLADNMQGIIDNKFADRLENTPKRMAQAAKARAEGYHLQRAQQLLYKLADHAEAGTTPDLLHSVNTKAKALELTKAESRTENHGFHYYQTDSGLAPKDASPEQLAAWVLLDDSDRESEEIKTLENQVKLSNIPSFYPTPANIVNKMLEYADIQPGMAVLEPSAGSGAILSKLPDCDVTAYEYNHTLCNLLDKKGFNVEQGDFMQAMPPKFFDRVVMNPPFEKQQDIMHVSKAYISLKPGGRIVAIMSAGITFRDDKKTTGFMKMIQGKSEVIPLPEKSFSESGTNVNAVMVIIDKPMQQAVAA